MAKFFLGFGCGVLASLFQPTGFIGWEVSIYICTIIAVVLGFLAGPAGFLAIFLVIPLAFIINGLVFGTIFWLVGSVINKVVDYANNRNHP